MTRRSLLIAGGLWLALRPARAADVTLRSWTGAQGGGPEGQMTVAAAAEWQALWARVGRAPAAPFAAGDVGIGLFLGQRPEAGHGVRFERAVDQLGEIVVSWREVAPDPAAVQAQVLTEPWAIALVRPDGRPVRLSQLPLAFGR